MVEVHLATPLRPIVRGAGRINVEGRNLREVLNNLETQYPGFKEKILEPDGSLKPHICIFINSKDVRFLKGIETPIEDGDMILILPAVMGG